MRATSSGPSRQAPINGVGAIEFAKRRFPRLSADGIVPVSGARCHQPIMAAEVECAADFLSILAPIETARVDSYALKHACEDWCREHDERRRYISNGALMVAALALGLPVQPCGPTWLLSPNCLIGVSAKSVRRVVTATAVLRMERQEKFIVA